MKTTKASTELLWITPEPEKQIEIAGRTCYISGDKITNESAGDFVVKLRNAGHHAMLEHGVASFRIITDRGISHEIVRHRIASYAQESTRYCNYSKTSGNQITSCTFIEPPGLDDNQYLMWRKACQFAEDFYFDLLKTGQSPQIARAVLPNCLKTEIVMTANFREWRHFIELRCSRAAHPQIQPIAFAILNKLYHYAPNIFEDLMIDLKG